MTADVPAELRDKKSSPLSPAYKKHLYVGLGGYAVFVGILGLWIGLHAKTTLETFNARVPNAKTAVKPVYLSAVTTDITHDSFAHDNVGTSPFSSSAFANGKGHIALVMGELGTSKNATERAFDDLPPQVSLAFLPYTDLTGWIEKAKKEERDALLMIPLDPRYYPTEDPGPLTLLRRVSDKENQIRLKKILAAGAGAVGTINFMGQNGYLTSRKKIQAVLETLEQNHLFFVENMPPSTSTAKDAAKDAHIAYSAVDIDIDGVATENNIRQKLVELERQAHEKGQAVGYIRPYPLTFVILKAWSEDVGRRGIDIVPVSKIAKPLSADPEQSHEED